MQGVFAKGNASLDARLRDHQDINTLVVGQLQSLLRHLKTIKVHKSSGDVYRANTAAEHAYDNAETSSAYSEYSFSALSSNDATSQRSRTTSIEGLEAQDIPSLMAIINATNRLHRVSMAIRRSGMTSHEMKAAMEHFYDEDGRDVIQVFSDWCLEVLHHKFAAANKLILDRIAHVNGERRRQFLYRKKHQRKLASRAHEALGTNKDTIVGTNVQKAPLVPSNSGYRYRLESGSRLHSTVQGSVARLSQTTASKVARESYHYQPSVLSTMVSVAPSTQLPHDFSMYPPAPKVPTGAGEFHCPYCCRIHNAVERSGKRWKQHFLKDLSPFVCLVENCNTPNKTYPDQQTWIKHMESHNIKYTCQHHESPVRFSQEADFDQHILTEHGHFPPARLANLRSINGSSSRVDICTCPICGFVPKSLSPGQLASQNDLSYRELTTHIANDLHYIALWSLDEGNDADLDIASNASDVRTINDKTHSDGSTFSNQDHDLNNSVINDWQDESYSPDAGDVESEPPEGTDALDEWFLVYEKKFPYSGHEHDPKLQNFVRRFQLEKLPEEGQLADPQLPCYFLSFRTSKDFYGRHLELDRLETSLHPARTTKNLHTMTLTGPAGIGKTELAAQYCQQFQSRYDVVLWAHADEESKLANDFVEIAIQLGFISKDLPESRDQEHCRQLVKAWLTDPRKAPTDPDNLETARWLLVFDHVIDPKLIIDYWPTDCKCGSVLTTSRKTLPWSTTHLPVLDLEPFAPTDSAAFLSRLLKAEGIGGKTFRLGSRAFHSPTQLIFLAKMIALKRYSLENFVKASQDDDGKKAILVLHTEDVTANQTNFSEWALESLSPMAAALLDVMAILDPDKIIESLLTHPPDTISIVEYPKNPNEYNSARAELSSFSLISRGRPTGNLNIHRLIQDAACRNMSEQYYGNVFNTCIALISDKWPYQPFTWRHGISRWAKCEDLYPHIIRLQSFLSRVPISEYDIDKPYEFARLATDVAWYCHERGRLTEVGLQKENLLWLN